MSSDPVGAAVVLGARNLGAAITRDLLVNRTRVVTVARTQSDLDPLEQAFVSKASTASDDAVPEADH
jgi:short-subunit dehydrogenase